MSEQTTSDKENASRESTQNEYGDLDYGYDFYPERRGGEQRKGLLRRVIDNYSTGATLKCYENVQWCMRKSKYIMYMSV